MNYYKRFCGDYLRDTAHLSLIEHGAYTLLLDTYYSTERPLPNDPATLYRIARAMSAADRKAVDRVVAEFFPVGEDGLRHNQRADVLVAEEQNRIAKARSNGQKGGRPPEKPAGLFPGNPSDTGTGAQDERENLSEKNHRQRHKPVHPTLGAIAPSVTENLSLSGNTQDLDRLSQPGSSTPPRENSGMRAREGKTTAQTTVVWDVYAAAYQARYGVAPVRNARVNAQLVQLLRRLGHDEAPHVARWYVVRANATLYVRAKHPVDLLLRDAEGLRTEWATQRTVTDAEARSTDARQSTVNAFAPLLARATEEEKHGKS